VTTPPAGWPIPLGPEQLTAEWLSAALGTTAARAGGVTSFAVEPMPEGLGFIGRVARVRLTYGARSQGPASLVAKFPAADAAARVRTMAMNLREARFYQELAGRAHRV
jgi:hypothetical protein